MNPRPRRALISVAAIGVALVFAALDAGAIDLADPWNRPDYSFGFAFPRLIIPWTLLAVMCLGAGALASWLRVTRSNALLTVPLHAVASLLLAVSHLCAVGGVHQLLFTNNDPYWHRVGAMLTEYTPQDVLAYWCVVVLVHAFLFRAEARQREMQALELQATLAEARLAALRSQLHPHFLFNTLNTAAMLVREGTSTKAVDVLDDLGALLRHVLDTESHEIPLADEVALVRRYVRIEQERFHDRLTVRFHLADEVRAALVPSLILQPLVENAIRYGVAPRSQPGTVEIHAYRLDGRVVLEVRDEGPSLRESSANGHGIGLQNTRERLRQLYGDAAECTLSHHARGTAVKVVMPFHETAAVRHDAA